MKILLVNPSAGIWNTRNTMPLGLAYIAAVLEQQNYDVRVLDLTVENKSGEQIKKEIRSNDIVGITSTTPTIYNAWNVCSIAKEEGVPVAMGGPHPTALPQESVDKCDIIVNGEGEKTIVDVCNAIDGKKIKASMKKVRGIYYKQGKKIVSTGKQEFIKNLDSIPFPAMHLFPDISNYSTQHPLLDKKVISGSIITSRGCPYNCVFCFKSIFGNVYRYRSPQNVVEEWKLLVEEYNVKEIGIVDDSFTSYPKRAIEICKLIVEQNLQTPWLTPSGIRIKPVSRELLQWMMRSGCYRVAFGIESGSQRVLEKIGKKLTLREIEESVKLAKSVGLETLGFFMIGNYGDDMQSIKQTIAFSKKLDLDYAQYLITVPYPGSMLFNIVKQRGRFLINKWDEYGTFEDRAYFELDEVTEELVERMHKQAYRDFYVNPKFIMRKALDKKTIMNANNYIKALMRWIG